MRKEGREGCRRQGRGGRRGEGKKRRERREVGKGGKGREVGEGGAQSSAGQFTSTQCTVFLFTLSLLLASFSCCDNLFTSSSHALDSASFSAISRLACCS